jgi:hypothetical protein
MSEHQSHHQELPKDEHDQAFLPYHPPRSNVQDRPEAGTRLLAQSFDHFHGPYSHFGLLSGPYDHVDNAGTLVNYQHAFQPIVYDTQYQPPAFSGSYTPTMYAPTGSYNPSCLEQHWKEEIHPSYTPIGGDTFEWAASNSTSQGSLANTPLTNLGEQFVYEHTSNILPANQYYSVESNTSDDLITHFMPETTPRIPLQHVASTRLGSTAAQVQNEKRKTDITKILYETSDHTGHRPLRVSKTKKTDKAENNNVKQEACWRCKRYRKAVSLHAL